MNKSAPHTLQSVDAEPNAERQRWIGVLARADLEILEAGMAGLEPLGVEWLRKPETGLMMVRARAGGTGERFNFGEMTVTRCALRLASGAAGVAYVRGRSKRHAELAALADALLQTKTGAAAVRSAVLLPAERALAEEAARMQRRAQATRVEFFTVAREAG
jgi:alpha-D-ribose 1-methylphosphonate 5-triphosphate synthase subunit PhnG